MKLHFTALAIWAPCATIYWNRALLSPLVYRGAKWWRAGADYREQEVLDLLAKDHLLASLDAAEKLGVFDAISGYSQGVTFDELLAKLQVSRKGLDALLATLVTGGYIDQDPMSMRLHCQPRGGLSELLMTVVQGNQVVRQRQHYYLAESVATGEAMGLRRVFGDYSSLYTARSDLPEVARYWDPWMEAVGNPRVTEAMSRLVVGHSKSRRAGGRFRMLDWCGNLGHSSLRSARAFPFLDATVLDLPAQVAKAEASIRAAGMEGRVDTLAADLEEPRTVRVPPERFDGVLMTHTIREWSPAALQVFWGLIHAGLKPGGSLVVDMVSQRRQGEYPESSVLRGGPEAYFLNVASHVAHEHHVEDVNASLRAAGFEVVTFAPLLQDVASCEAYDAWECFALVARRAYTSLA